jgi:hypothetical protein
MLFPTHLEIFRQLVVCYFWTLWPGGMKMTQFQTEESNFRVNVACYGGTVHGIRVIHILLLSCAMHLCMISASLFLGIIISLVSRFSLTSVNINTARSKKTLNQNCCIFACHHCLSIISM